MKLNTLIAIIFLGLNSCGLERSQTWEIMSDEEFDKGNMEKSLMYLNKAIAVTPQRSILYLKKALCYSDLEKYSNALNSIDSSILLCDTVYTAYSIRASILTKLNQIDSSLVYHSKAIKLKSDPSAYFDRGDTYNELGEYDKALADFDKAILLDSTYYLAYYHRARIRALIHEDFPNAISDLTLIIDKFKPETLTDKLLLGSTYMIRGACYDKSRNLSLACHDWNKALGLGQKEANKYLVEKCGK